jgi:iron complex transport system substrate-binding protein
VVEVVRVKGLSVRDCRLLSPAFITKAGDFIFMKESKQYSKHNLRLIRQTLLENLLPTSALFQRIVILSFLVLSSHFSVPSFVFAEPPNRIISLAPSTTEILFAAGLGDRVVGVTTFCDYPQEAKRKSKVGGMSNPSLEAVISLKPDIVIMTTDGNPEEFEKRLRSMKIETHVFESLTLSELPDGIRRMGIALDEKERFDDLALEMEETINSFKIRSQKSKNSKLETRNSKLETKVLFIIWPEPLIAAGPKTAIDDVINLLGWKNIARDAKSRYPKYSIEEILRQSPDVIFIGKGHKDMKKLSSGLLKRLPTVPAVKNKKVFYVSDSLYRLGPRVIKGMEELVGYLNETK